MNQFYEQLIDFYRIKFLDWFMYNAVYGQFLKKQPFNLHEQFIMNTHRWFI